VTAGDVADRRQLEEEKFAAGVIVVVVVALAANAKLFFKASPQLENLSLGEIVCS